MISRYNTCPYREAPPGSVWAQSVGGVPLPQLNPHLRGSWRVNRETRIGTAGSCFAQNLSRALRLHNFNFLVTEPAPSWLDEAGRARFNYEVFSARFGNIYTVLHLLQLFERAFGRLQPADAEWRAPDGHWYDLLRPRIQPNGFASLAELQADRSRHLLATRQLFETVEVFIFTLGLTEAWRSRIDGLVYPLCPGCGAGEFSPEKYEFYNFPVREVAAQLYDFMHKLKEVNPGARVLFTVSPVPLAATMEKRHVLQASVYSKSVLRVAVEEVVRHWPNAAYFAAYEIITATFRTHEFFGEDRRTVTPAGVDRAMAIFLEQFADLESPTSVMNPVTAARPSVGALEQTGKGEYICDEEALFEALAGLHDSNPNSTAE